jgi:hypothetical protein
MLPASSVNNPRKVLVSKTIQLVEKRKVNASFTAMIPESAVSKVGQ